MGQQYTRFTQEAAFGVFNTSPSANQQFDLYLTTDSDMTTRAEPEFTPIRDAGFGNRLIRMIQGHTKVGGNVNTYLFPSQTLFWMNIAAGLVGTAPCLNLPTFTIDHLAVRDYDCGKEYRRYLGNMISKLTLKSDSTANGWLWSVMAESMGAVPATITISDYPTPPLSAYASDDPYNFNQTLGLVSINSAVQSNYQNLTIDIANTIQAFADENIYASSVNWFGRTVTVDITLRYKSPAFRLLYEVGTKMPITLEINTGSHTLTLNFGAQCIIQKCSDVWPMGGYFVQQLSFTAMMDPTLSPPSDLAYTTT